METGYVDPAGGGEGMITSDTGTCGDGEVGMGGSEGTGDAEMAGEESSEAPETTAMDPQEEPQGRDEESEEW